MAAKLQKDYPWIRLPLVCSAPMRGSAGPRLAAQVSKAGGIGFVGTVGDRAQVDVQMVEARKALSDSRLTKDGRTPFGFGFLCFATPMDYALSLIQDYKPVAVWLFSVHELEDYAAWTKAVRSVSDAKIWIQTGSVADALDIARACRPDTLVLQGLDAGGHGAIKGAGIISLLPEAADALAAEDFGDIPLIATGGIADHRGAAASIVLGAAGVVMGTRFLAAEEVDLAHPSWRESVLNASDGGQSTLKATVFDEMNKNITWPSWFDGRALRNNTSKDWERGLSKEENRKLFEDAAKLEQKGYSPSDPRATVWAGTGVGLVRDVLPAARIVEQTRAAAARLLTGMSSNL